MWLFIFMAGMATANNFISAHSDHRIREVTVTGRSGQLIECPGQSRITILFSKDLVGGERINECDNDFYEFYVSRRCTFKRSCELPRFDSSLQKNCPTEKNLAVMVRYKCTLGKDVIRMTRLSSQSALTMSCPFDTSIRLVKATHGNRVENCIYKTAFQFIQDSCRYKKMCTVAMNSIPDIRACHEFSKRVEIDYTCQNYTVNVVSAVKGESLTIRCPSDYMIDIQSANYTSGTGQCFDPLAELTVIDKCSTKNSCIFRNDVSQHFMNLCFKGQRRLEVAYTCVKVKDTKKFLVFQDGMLDLACRRGQIIQIVSAKYGNDELDCWSILTQKRLNEECEGKTKCCASANEDFLGISTCPKNTRKSLTVIYQCQAITNLETLENAALEEKEGKVCESIRFELAASFGRLTSQTIKTMDRDLLITIGGSLPKLKEMSVKSFDDVIRYMKNIEFLTVNDDSYLERSDSFNNTEFGIKDFIDRENVAILDMKFAKEHLEKRPSFWDKILRSNETKIELFGRNNKFHAITWYRKLVGNSDILSEAQIDIDELSDLVTTVGAGVHSIRTSVFNREGGNQTVVDMAILRFPDFDNPFFLIYNIRLTAWWKTSRLLIFEKARSGMSGQFRSMKFLPNREFIRTSNKELIDKALNEVNNLFEMPLV